MPLSLRTVLIPLMALAAPLGAAPTPAAVSDPAAQSLTLPLMPTVSAEHRSCNAKAASGLGYRVLRPGQGASPGATDFVLINYIGYLAATGVTFDQAMRAPMALDGVVPGFAEGIRTMAKGGIARLCIPAAMAYGDKAEGPIPANSDLVFQVELLDFKTRAEITELNRSATEAQEQQQHQSPAPAPKQR
jgi:FKBP-type peptidyl-prolyl cis-trans isomerase FkpA